MQSAKLGVGTKLSYGVGLAAEGIKQNAFQVFLLFFYQQLVGLDPALCGLALFTSLCADAVLDPVIGAWSDGLRSRLGRRHPFMYASILPMSLSYVLVFNPPAGMDQTGKFLWLLTFSVATRVSMALFVIPHQSLVPELSSDSGERASLSGFRVVFAWIFALLTSFLGYGVFMRSTPEFPQGLLNAKAYVPFTIVGAILMFVSMLSSALLTQRAALARSHTVGDAHIPMRELPKAMRRALQNDSYRAVVIAGLLLFSGYGMQENLNNYMNMFFWGFTTQQITGFVLVILLASLFVLGTARPFLVRFGSRKVGMACAVIMMTVNPLTVVLRMLGLMPDKGSSALFLILCVSAFIGYAGVIMNMTVVGKMIADVTDEHELATGARQEGLLFSASIFMQKAASGIGTLVSGVLIKATRFPENVAADKIDPRIVLNLGVGAAMGGILFGGLIYYYYSRFNLDQARHAEIVAELTRRRSAQLPVQPQQTPPAFSTYASATE